MNLAMMRRARGMGDLPAPGISTAGFPTTPDWVREIVAGGGSNNPTYSSSAPSTMDRFAQITALISQGLNTVLAMKVVDKGQFQNVANNPQLANNPQYQQWLNSQGGSGFGFGLDSQGIRLSDGSHIGWSTIAIVVAAFFLLQSKGFSRK